MNCEQAKQSWHQRLEDEHANEALDRHLDVCADCRDYAADMARIAAALATLSQETEGIRAALPVGHRAFAQWTRLARMAAVIAILVGLYAVVRLTTSPSSPVQMAKIGSDAPGKSALPPDITASRTDGPLGITLRGESAKSLLAVAAPTHNPDVQLYWLYPRLHGEDAASP